MFTSQGCPTASQNTRFGIERGRSMSLTHAYQQWDDLFQVGMSTVIMDDNSHVLAPEGNPPRDEARGNS